MDSDFLVIGAGVAGLRAAIELAAAGRVLVVAKESLHESASEYAQGGIAAALADDDEIELHENDTIYAGDGLCDRAAVHALVADGTAAIEQLIEWGAEFDREGSHLAFAREGAHSRNRVLHAHGDSTGHEIARVLYRKACSLANVTFRSYSAVTDLLMDGDRVGGAVVCERGAGDAHCLYAPAVLLATGGLGQVFGRTTNPLVATGDGVAMAYRAGAEIADIEFVQFHPTALAVTGAPHFLISEALRGEGAVLTNAASERFMARVHPMGDLAPRDVVARAIVAEMTRTGGPVYLDLTSKGEAFARERFPRIHATCLAYGIDLGRQAVPSRRRRTTPWAASARTSTGEQQSSVYSQPEKLHPRACMAPTVWRATRCWKGWYLARAPEGLCAKRNRALEVRQEARRRAARPRQALKRFSGWRGRTAASCANARPWRRRLPGWSATRLGIQ